MRKIVLSVLLGILLVSTAWTKTAYVSGKGIFLDSYDPVAYFLDKKATQGDKKYSYKYDGVEIHFKSEKNKALFKASPEKYMPQYKGWCAYAMAKKGSLVSIDPKSFRLINNKLYLFYDGLWGDTLKKWKKEGDQPQVEAADKNWNKVNKG